MSLTKYYFYNIALILIHYEYNNKNKKFNLYIAVAIYKCCLTKITRSKGDNSQISKYNIYFIFFV